MTLIAIPQTIGAAVAVPRVAPSQSQPTAAQVIAEAGAAPAPDAAYVGSGVGLLIAGSILGLYLQSHTTYKFTPTPGTSVFALFYVFAQTLERLAELVSLIWPGAGGTKPAAAASRITKQVATERRNEAVAQALNAPSQVTVKAAADAQSTLDRVRLNRTVLAWTFTSALAIAGSGALGLQLIAALSSTSAAPPWLDLVITGLAVGGGTKPLHDLIASLQESRKAKQDPPATGGK